MKKILLPLIFCFIMISCASTRKSVQMSCTSQTNTESAEKQTSKTEKVVDTTKTESGKVTITEIEFYPPSDCQHDKDMASEAPQKKPKADKPKGNNVGEINLSNVGNIKDAAIKSSKQRLNQKRSKKEKVKNPTKVIILRTKPHFQIQVSPERKNQRPRPTLTVGDISFIFYLLLR